MTVFPLDIPTRPTFGIHSSRSQRAGLQRLFAAAIVSDKFREILLRQPEEALAKGYLGQPFLLTDQEKMIIKSIQADTLTDLAQKVNRALKAV